MSSVQVAYENPPRQKGVVQQPDRHYRRIAKEKDWESRVAHHQDLGYRVEAELGASVVVSCDSTERWKRQKAAEEESRLRTLAKLAGTEAGFVKREDSMTVQAVSSHQMEQAMAAAEPIEVDG